MKKNILQILLFGLLALINHKTFSQSVQKFDQKVVLLPFPTISIGTPNGYQPLEQNPSIADQINARVVAEGNLGYEFVSMNSFLKADNIGGANSYIVLLGFKKNIVDSPVPVTNSLFPFNVSLGSLLLFESYKNVLTGYGTKICDPVGKIPSVSSAMPVIYYGNIQQPGIVTFTSFVLSKTKLRTIWDSRPGSFNYYGVCAPNPIIYPTPVTNTQNDVYEGGLIEVEAYKKSLLPPSDRTYANLITQFLDLTTVQTITSVQLEPNNEPNGINQNEPNLYNNVYSSKGIVVSIQYKSDPTKTVKCYYLNNYDTGGTLIYKTVNSFAVKMKK